MLFLTVPYAEKDEAKALGARWNPTKRRWYVPDGVSPAAFAKWTGKDGVRMMQVIRPKKTVPIHYNDYDVFKSPLEDFAREVKAAGLERDVVYLAHGETYAFRRVQR